MSDEIKSPSHYTDNGIECKDAMKAAMDNGYFIQPQANDGEAENIPPMAFYWWGCAFKYLWRWSRKGGITDLRKCQQCIDYLIDEVES